MRHHRHERRSGPRVVVNHIVIFAVDSAVNGMNDAVALSSARMLEKRRGEDALAAGREHDVDRIIHAAGHHRLDSASIRATTKDVSGPSDQGWFAGSLISLLGEGAFAPVNPAVRAKVRAVQIVGASCQGLALKPLDPLVGHAVTL